MTRRVSDLYVETQLVLIRTKGDVVILDNLSAYKSEKAEKAVRARDA